MARLRVSGRSAGGNGPRPFDRVFGSFHPAAVGRVAAAGHAFAVASFGVLVFAVIAGIAVFLLPKRPAAQA